MLKIRRPLGRLIFNMGIAIPGKTVFLIETAPRGPSQYKDVLTIGIPISKIRWSHDRLIFNIGISIPGKTVSILKWDPGDPLQKVPAMLKTFPCHPIITLHYILFYVFSVCIFHYILCDGYTEMQLSSREHHENQSCLPVKQINVIVQLAFRGNSVFKK